MTETLTTQGIPVHPLELDLLCAFAEMAPPFPLDVPTHGNTHAQRQQVFRAARHQLAARGLVDRHGPTGVAATFVRLLREATGALDLVLAVSGRSTGAVVLLDDSRALLAIQSPDDAGRLVWLTELDSDDAVPELLALPPVVAAADVPSFTLPLRPVRRVFERIVPPRPSDAWTEPPTLLSDADIDALLDDSGVDERLAARLATNFRRVSGSGQAGSARWHPHSRSWRRIGAELHWIDTARGRFRVSQDEHQLWGSVSPLSHNDIRAELRRMAADARQAATR
ncbi:MAG TPA: ESX secretion-associated protein EspG [Pseudonocardiaceae bacterium]|jgi:hypothetical protein|nr:ESX secretion-associated protein EspG [Pseudonocardiaceae bacterium]